MTNNSIKRVGGIALFSAMLSVGVGFTPLINETVVHAESTEQSNQEIKIPNGYKKSSISGVYDANAPIEQYKNTRYYRIAAQSIEAPKSTVISLSDPILDKMTEDETPGTISVRPNLYFVEHSFKQNEKIKLKLVVKDPLKQSSTSNVSEAGKKIELNNMEHSSFMFYSKGKESPDVVNPENVSLTFNENNTEATYTFEINVPSNASAFYTDYTPKILGNRNTVKKDSSLYEKLNELVEKSNPTFLSSLDVYLTDEKNDEIVSPVNLMSLWVTKENDYAVEKNNMTFKNLGLSFMVDSSTLDVFKTTNSDQSVKANVLNGGITGGIVNPEVGKNLAIKDVDFGKLSIGQVIEPVKEDTMVSVRDWTGGNGWKLTAQHKYADRNQSLQLGVQVNEKTKVDLSDEAQLVTSGESQLDVTTQGGEYTAKWGTHPTVGEFNNVIEWNLTANVTE